MNERTIFVESISLEKKFRIKVYIMETHKTKETQNMFLIGTRKNTSLEIYPFIIYSKKVASFQEQ